VAVRNGVDAAARGAALTPLGVDQRGVEGAAGVMAAAVAVAAELVHRPPYLTL
jgi:hypothetical protein